METQIDLLRHGEPLGGKRYRGQTDDPLSDEGWRQMREAVAGSQGWELVLTSPLRRCAEFARELGIKTSVPVIADDRLMEIGFGEWEGRTPDDLRRIDPDILVRFWLDPVGQRPAGAEPLEDFGARVTAAWNDILRLHAGKRVLVVAHAGVIRMVVTIVLGSPLEHMFRIQVGNAGMTRIRVHRRGTTHLPMLVFHGGAP